MRIAKHITVSVVCVCGEKLDAILTDDKDLINDIIVVVDNTHICPATQYGICNCKTDNDDPEAHLSDCPYRYLHAR